METSDKNENQKLANNSNTSPAKLFQVTKANLVMNNNNNNNNKFNDNNETSISNINAQTEPTNNNVNNNNNNSAPKYSSGISKLNNFIRQLFESNENETSSNNNNNKQSSNNRTNESSKLKQKNSVSSNVKIDNNEKKKQESINQNLNNKKNDIERNNNKPESIIKASEFKNKSNQKNKKELNLILNRTLSDSVLERKSAIYSGNNTNSVFSNSSRKDYGLSRKNSSNRRSIYITSTQLNSSFSPIHYSKKNSLFLSTSPSPLNFSMNQTKNNLIRTGLHHHKSTCSIYHNNNNNSPTMLESSRKQVLLSDNLIDHHHHHQKTGKLSLDQMNIKRISSLLSVSSATGDSPNILKKKMNNVISSGIQQQTQKTYLGSNNNNENSSSPVVFQVLSDARRWSFASSSGYGTNTPINNLEENKNNNNNSDLSNHSIQYSSNDYLSSSLCKNTIFKPSNLCFTQENHFKKEPQIEIHLQKCNIGNNFSSCSNSPQTTKIIDYDRASETSSMFQFPTKRSRINSSNEETNSQLDDSSETGFSPSVSFQKQRARSLSCSPAKEYNDSNIIQIQNEAFKEKFPKACSQMEEKLENFIDSNKDLIEIGQCHQLDPAARFVHNQVVELAKLCLERSKANQLNNDYFDEITITLERLLQEAKEKFLNIDISLEHLRKLIRSFLLIISRVARLLECIEFDPFKFCDILDSAEKEAKNEFNKANNIPKYVISKLGLNRDIIDDIKKLGQEESEGLPYNNNNDKDSIKTSINNNLSTPNQTDFEEIKLISNGAYGAVYLSKHRQTGERYAIKKIKKQNILLRNQLKQVYTERDIMIFSDNPFVVSMICSFETKSYLCMVMEYVEGGDVASLIEVMGPLPLDLARIYFAETTLAVEYLHNYGIIHRDLKPDNLLITSLGHIKLTDFGLSKIGLMSLTANFYEQNFDFMKDHYCKEFDDKQIYGTPQYLAPEVILRQPYGKAVDWWSMGIILYEFLTSLAPFSGNTPDELFENVLEGEIEWPEADDQLFIPEDAKSLIMSLLTRDPVKRLGGGGANEIKLHRFFCQLDWKNLLIIKTEFIPQLNGPDDTHYFDTRSERYNHELDDNNISPRDNKPNEEIQSYLINQSSSNSIKPANELSDLLSRNLKLEYHHQNDDSDLLINDDTDNELFASFSSCSSKFRLSSVSNTNSPVFMNDQSKTKNSNINQNLIITTNEDSSLVLNHQTSEESSNFSAYLNKLPNEKKYFAEISSDEESLNLNNKNEHSNNNESYKIVLSTPKPTATDSSSDILNENNKTITTTIQSKIFDVLENKLKNEQTSSNNKESSNHSFKLFKRKQRKNTNKNNNNDSIKTTQSQNESTQLIESTIVPAQSERIRKNSSSINILDSENTFKPISSTNKDLNTSSVNQQNDSNNSLSNSRKNLLSIPSYNNRKDSSNKFINVSKQQNKNRLLKEMSQIAKNRPVLTIKRGNRGFGFTLRSIKVFYGKTDLFIIEHLVIQIDEQGPAYQAGLRMNDLILSVNDELVCGKMHPEIVKLIMSSKDNLLRLRTVPLSETNIRSKSVHHQNNNSFFRQDSHHIKRNQSGSIKIKEYTLYPSKSNEKNSTNYLDNTNNNEQNNIDSNNLHPPNFNGNNNKLGYSLVDRKKKKTLLRKLSEKRAQKYDFKQQQQQQQLPQNDSIHKYNISHSQSNSSSSSSSLNNSPSITIRKPSNILVTTEISSADSGCQSPSDSINNENNFSRKNMSTSDLSSCVISSSKSSSCSGNDYKSSNNNSNIQLNKLESTFKKFSISNLYQPSSTSASSSPSLSNISNSNRSNKNNNDDDVFINYDTNSSVNTTS